ncbi:CheR family methyltransferase [Sulfurimonas microaerophilic]|uniref:CheR family methyltransferase n=1 Tax=Sulfurimonas microaerophilic TaxID=3058392 RepID=UPI002714BBA4|nr:CheR family methyltransferase [Sulfurimonas sp. hsl 1-7]
MKTMFLNRCDDETHKVVIKGEIDEETISQLDIFLETTCIDHKIELIFENVYIVPREMVEWLKKLFATKKYPIIKVDVTQERLYSYLHSLGIKVNIFCDKEGYSDIKVIALGGSAGSTSMFQKMLSCIVSTDVSVFLVQHASYEGESLLPSVLQRFTSLEVISPKHLQKVEKAKVYVAPPNYHMKVENGHIVLDQSARVNYSRPSVSVLYKSIAQEYGPHAVCITSCGYGHDGSDVVEDVLSKGTYIIAQEPLECEARLMPSSISQSGKISHILSVDVICELLRILNDSSFVNKELLFFRLLKKIYGYDFTHYNLQSLKRLLNIEIQRCTKENENGFYHSVILNKDRFEKLLFALTVNVTEFFRKPHSFKGLNRFIQQEQSVSPHLKFWVAGCASGEEAYSLGMMLHEDELLENSLIYATDINEMMVQIARNGLYSVEHLATNRLNAQAVLQNKPFDENIQLEDTFFSIKEEIRRKILFFHHNLATDSSFNEFNFILCKNVLIYFDDELQNQVFQLFYDSLSLGGYLQLGTSETLLFEFRDRFKVVDIESRIFQKVV